MTDEPPPGGFRRRPRSARYARAGEHARVNFLTALDAIESFRAHAVAGGRQAFARDSGAYAAGSMTVIRAASLFEVRHFDRYLADAPEGVARGIRALRNIVSHAGYEEMDDDVLWRALTEELPPYIAAWRAAAEE